jgi:hypothetical protein
MTTVRPAIALAARARSKDVRAAAFALAAAVALSPCVAQAESSLVTGAGTASARLNFSIVIPKFLYLQVGTGTYPTTAATIDNIVFDMSTGVASIGNGTAQAATAASGDQGNGTVTARVVGNNFTAAVNLSATTTSAMSNGAGNTISWSEISVASAAQVTVPAAASLLPHPGSAAAPFANAAATTVSLTPVSKIINQAAKWTFTYKNTNVPASGTYGGAANGGQVTYAIAMP